MSREQKILRQEAVLEMTGLSRTTLWRLRNAKKFPPPVKLSTRAIGWLRSEIERWLRNLPEA